MAERDDLLERLRANNPPWDPVRPEHQLRNPDGPEAADRIERLEAEVAAMLAAIPGVRFMDPPDGGDPKPHEEVQRMADALKAAEAEVARLTAEREKDRECYGCVNPNNACARCKPRLAALQEPGHG